MSKFSPLVILLSCLSTATILAGCAQTRSSIGPETVSRPKQTSRLESKQTAPDFVTKLPDNAVELARPADENDDLSSPSVVQVSNEERLPTVAPADSSSPSLQDESTLDNSLAESTPLLLDDVINSVVISYPLLRTAMLGRNVAQGDLLAANGEFDLKLKGDTLNMPLGFYENYRQSIGAEQPLFGGGSVFGGYRLGQGSFPTYYGERATKLGGEFKAGMSIPLAQNRTIDDRRAGLWRNQWEVQAVEPEIQSQFIEFIRLASLTYWNWVAAGQNVQIAEDLLKNATDRNTGLKIRVEKGDAPAIELTDNERLIVSRRTKLIDAQRKYQQSIYKLSLFLRNESGQPLVIETSRLPRDFPVAIDPSQHDLNSDIQTAIANRPELRALAIYSEQLRIDLASANNLSLPQLDLVLAASQDVGNPADPKKDDKSPFELEGGLVASIPLQRRKASGKRNAIEAKLAQVRAKSEFTENKITAEIQSASTAWNAAYQQLAQAHLALDLARRMEVAERRKFDLGDSNLLLVNLREQATADAAAIAVEAHLNYVDAQVDYRAALATDVVPN